MASVFKYYAPQDYNLDALIHQYFWFSKREYLNDPYDMNAQIIETFPKFKDLLEKYGYDLDKTLNDFAICCFAQNNDSQYFWSHYADTFRGWCLEFDADSLVDIVETGVPNRLYDVLYIDEYPNFNDPSTELTIKQFDNGDFVQKPIRALLHKEKDRENLFAYLLRVKQKEAWGAEKEKRLILGNIHLLSQKGKYDKGTGYQIPWKQNALKSIIMGNNISDSNKFVLEHIAQQLGITLQKAKPILTDRHFSIAVDTLSKKSKNRMSSCVDE